MIYILKIDWHGWITNQEKIKTQESQANSEIAMKGENYNRALNELTECIENKQRLVQMSYQIKLI